MLYENRKYLIFNVSEINKIIFSEILETSVDSMRRSLDGSKTFIKWEGSDPPFISTLLTKEGPYSHSEILSILSTSDWKDFNIIN